METFKVEGFLFFISEFRRLYDYIKQKIREKT